MARTNTESVTAEPETAQAEPETAQGEQESVVTLSPVLDAAAVKTLTVEQISSMTLFQLAGLDMRHDLLNADQSKAVADAITAKSRATVKAVRKVAKERERGENVQAWNDFMKRIGPEILAQAESGLNKYVERVAVCVTRLPNGTFETDSRMLKTRRFNSDEKPYEIPQSETDQETPGEQSGEPETEDVKSE